MRGLVVEGLRKRYGSVLAVDGVSLHVEPGSVVGLVGPNGAGKSTTLKSIVGLVVPDGGRILVDGVDVLTRPEARRVVGYAPELPILPRGYTVCGFLEELAMLEGVGDAMAAVKRVLGMLGVESLCDRKTGGLSKGQRKRVAIAQALLGEKRYLVLDEPFTGLDPEWVSRLKELVRRVAGEGVGVLVTSHLLRELQDIIDHVVFIKSGRVVFSGSIEEASRFTRTRVVARLSASSDELLRELEEAGARIESFDGKRLVLLVDEGVVERIVSILARARPISIEYHRVTLDELYEELAGG